VKKTNHISVIEIRMMLEAIQCQSGICACKVIFLLLNRPFSVRLRNKSRVVEQMCILQEHNHVVEIQHSSITKAEVHTRTHDYTLHTQTVIWMVDGNTSDVKCEQLSTGDFRIKFDNSWKYTSFQNLYEYILLDIDDNIFKIPVDRVCNEMILVKEWKPIQIIMNTLLTNPLDIWKLWKDTNEVKPILRIQQKGSGNGKTFGIWKSIAENQDKDFFIILTKQHSAKTVIHKELNEQMDREEWHINRRPRYATIESKFTNCGYTVRDSNRRQRCATLKSTFANRGYVIMRIYLIQIQLPNMVSYDILVKFLLNRLLICFRRCFSNATLLPDESRRGSIKQ